MGLSTKMILLLIFVMNLKLNIYFLPPYKSSTNGVVEVTHKEIRKHIMLNFIENEDEFEINNSISGADEVFKKVIENIEKAFKK